MPALHVRPATLDDSVALALLMTALDYPTSSTEMRERLTAILTRAEYVTFVVELDGAVVGTAGVMLAHFFEKNGRYARLVALVVDPAHRVESIGEQLVRKVERWATAHGASEVMVSSSNHRPGAHRFYERLGYRATGLRFVKVFPERD